MSLYSGKSADEVSAPFLILCQMRYWIIQVTEAVPGSPGKLSSQGSLGWDLLPAMQHVLRSGQTHLLQQPRHLRFLKIQGEHSSKQKLQMSNNEIKQTMD